MDADYSKGLKEFCHEIYQNSNSGKHHKPELNIKITAQIRKRGINNIANTKEGTNGINPKT